MIGWIKNLTNAKGLQNRKPTLEELIQDSRIATHRERIHRIMLIEIGDEVHRYFRSFDFHGNDLKSRIAPYYLKEMEEEDRQVIIAARLGHYVFLVESLLACARIVQEKAKVRLAAAKAAAEEYRKTQALKG